MNYLEEFEFDFWVEQLFIILYLRNIGNTNFLTLSLRFTLLLDEINVCPSILSGTFWSTSDYLSFFFLGIRGLEKQ